MPGNIVTINDSENLAWYCGDSQMEKIIGILNTFGLKHNSGSEELLEKFDSNKETRDKYQAKKIKEIFSEELKEKPEILDESI